jgi:hypothetical protein
MCGKLVIDKAAHTTPIRYNSAIFAQISATDYDVFLGTERSFTEIRSAPNPPQIDPSTLSPSLVVSPVTVPEDPSVYGPKKDLPIRARPCRT